MEIYALESHVGLNVEEFLLFYHVAKKIINKIIMNQLFKVNGQVVSENYQLCKGDLLSFDQLSLDQKINPNEIFYTDIDSLIVYEDDDFVIVNKPPFCLVHSDGISNQTVANYLSGYYKMTQQDIPVLVVHRLDYQTSGLLMFAKHFLSQAYLGYLLETRQIKKKYLCLCSNEFQETKGVINKALSKDRHCNKQRVSGQGQDAQTSFAVIKKINHDYLVEVTIKTGRKHQIRVHLASINHPIVGDPLYGGKKAQRLYLHASYLEFKHPRTLKTFICQKKIDFKEE